MSSDRRAAYDRVLERRRAVALAQHYRHEEGLSIAEIADRLGRSPAKRDSDARPSGGRGSLNAMLSGSCVVVALTVRAGKW